MKHRNIIVAALLATATGALANPFAFWNERFDTYPAGPGPAGSGGWTGWFNNNALQGNVSNTVACSGPRSAFISGNTDVVRPLSGFTNGKWIAKTSVFVPSSGGTGKTWWAVLNTYNPSGLTFSWSVALSFNRATGQVQWESGGALQGVGNTPIGIGNGPGTLPLVLDQWVDVWSEIDFSANTVSTFYNQQLIARTPWKPIAATPNNIAGINLYSENPTAAAYHDNLCVTRNIPRLWRRGRVDNFMGSNDPFYVRPGLKSYVQSSNPNPFWTGFDQIFPNRSTAFSFIGLPMGPCASFKGELKVRARAIGNATNDTFNISPTDLPPYQYNNTFAHAAGNIWNSTPTQFLTWNLGHMPANVSGTLTGVNLLPNINVASYLNWYSQDDTQLDFADLRLWTCRPWFCGFNLSPIGSVRQIARTDGKIDIELDPTVVSGVELETGDATGGGLTFENMPELRQAGTSFQIGSEGRVGGNDWAAQGYLNFSGFGTRAELRADFAPVSSTSQEVALFNASGQMIHSFTQPNNAMIEITGNARIVKGWKSGGAMYVRFGGTTTINGISNGVTACIVPRGPIAGWGTPFQALAVRSLGIASYTVSGATGCFNGAFINTEGAGTLSVEPTSVGLQGTGDGSEARINLATNYGADASLPPSWWKRPIIGCTWGTELLPQGGTRWDHLANAVFDGFSRARAVKTSFAGNGTSWDVDVDFSGSGGTGGNLRLYRNNVMVASFLNIPNGNWGTVTGLPGTVISDPLIPVCIKVLPEDEATGVTFTHNNLSFTVDRFEFTRLPGGPAILGYESVSFVTQNIPELVLESAVFQRSLKGQITANGRIANTYAGRNVVVEIVDTETQATLETHTVSLAANGTFEVLSNAKGLVEVYARATPFLRKKVATVVGEFGPDTLAFSVRNGDANGDNEIGAADFSVLAAAYDAVLGDPGFNPDADLNGDNEVGAADFSILAAGYDQVGD